MATARRDLPEDIGALRAALIAERARAARVEAELAVARAKASDDAAVIAHQRLQIEKLTRQFTGRVRSALSGCWIRWSWRLRNSKARPVRTRSPPSGPWPRRPATCRSRASARPANPFPPICRPS